MKCPSEIIISFCILFKITRSCDNSIYCKGRLLETVQLARIYNDSKTFVDMAQIHSPDETIDNFDKLMNSTASKPTKQQIKTFLTSNFKMVQELETWYPPDYKTNPTFLQGIEDKNVKNFTRVLISKWTTLARKVNESVKRYPEKHSLIPVPNGFIIPGGRFRELYYWDTYWIIKGLLLSEMSKTARGMLENLIFLVSKYGFVPNGSRIYYLNRSQPPLLSLMTGLYIGCTNDIKWLKRNIVTLEKELKWWLANRTLTVKKENFNYMLAHYSASDKTPRSESYYEDVKACSIFPENEKATCYKNIKSGAETGWDFSSRWIFDKNGSNNANISYVEGDRVVPVDLNAFLCRAFKEMSKFYRLLGIPKKATKWLKMSEIWQRSIKAVLYDKTDGIWYDYDPVLSKPRKYFYPSNFAPLWAKCYDVTENQYYGSRAAKYFTKTNITDAYRGGVPTSLRWSGQQWDLPNAFPPLQEIIVLGLHKTGNKEGENIAETFAKRWVASNMLGYSKHNEMFEKYDAIHPGEYGGGGEYTVQSGFGWTNGVDMSLIHQFYTADKYKMKCLL